MTAFAPGGVARGPVGIDVERACQCVAGPCFYRISACTCYPHGPEEVCTCGGCQACEGGVLGCACDIDWECTHGDPDYRQEWKP